MSYPTKIRFRVDTPRINTKKFPADFWWDLCRDFFSVNYFIVWDSVSSHRRARLSLPRATVYKEYRFFLCYQVKFLGKKAGSPDWKLACCSEPKWESDNTYSLCWTMEFMCQVILKKLLPSHNRSVVSLATEEGISNTTLYSWLKQCREKECLCRVTPKATTNGRLMPN